MTEREKALRDAAFVVRSISQVRIPTIFRGIGQYPGEDADGWRPLTPEERGLLGAASDRILALLKGEFNAG